ncbi:hypothetical protein EKI60_02565 [Candidatus Saccharibacteria bacterium]|nr:MAG: hypothetical protein EKI60_02565 [Candidatus Saccharibacteria bacterium]
MRNDNVWATPAQDVIYFDGEQSGISPQTSATRDLSELGHIETLTVTPMYEDGFLEGFTTSDGTLVAS